MDNTSTGFDFSDVSLGDILNQSAQDDMQDANDDSQDATNASTDNGASSDAQNDDSSANQDDDNSQDATSQDDVSDNTDATQDSEDTTEDVVDDADTEPTVIDELNEVLGYEIEGDFEDNVTGIADFTRKAGEQIGEQYVSRVFEQFPDVQQYLKYRAEGGDANRYFETVSKAQDYKSITEDALKEDIGIQKRLVGELYSKMGYTDDDIKDTIKDLEDSELLLKQSNIAKSKLDAMAEHDRTVELERQEIQAKEVEQQNVETWKQIGSTIKQGNLKGLVVPDKDKQAFYDWMSKPIDSKGTTQRAAAMEKIDTESTLALEYLYFKNFDLGKIARTVQASAKNTALRDRLRSGSGSGTSASNLNKGPKGGNSRAQKLPELKEIL